MNNEEQGIRVPRPMGTTEKGLQFNQDPTEENKQQLENHLINHYITNNFSYCNKHYNIEQLSILLSISSPRILGLTINYGHNLQATMDKLTNNEALRALFALSIQASLEDRGRAVEQYSILKASQGDKYKAFISGEVNKALKLVMETGSNMAAITKGLTAGTNINMLFQGAQKGPAADKQKGFVTIDEALTMINDHNHVPLGLNPAMQQRIYEDNKIDDTPEVCALKQEGVDTSKEALTLDKITDFSKDNHNDRRANEEGHDIDADEL